MSTVLTDNHYAWVQHFYHPIRQQEGRVYTDEEVLELPTTQPAHRHYQEWQMRKRSTRRLMQYIQRKKGLITIMEVGCGNGWLSRRLATVSGSRVIGMDINTVELQQATRVFSNIPNLQFLYGDIQSNIISDEIADIIVFAASIQYFPSLPVVIRHAIKKLRSRGEIHIIDSPIYKPGELVAARKRTMDYFHQMGFACMTEHYFHHDTTSFNEFNYKMLYQPSALQFSLSPFKNPFPWICIQKK